MAVSRDLRPRMVGRQFYDENLDLTGTVVMRCTFDGCIVHLNSASLIPAYMRDCLFVDCRLTGSGWRNTQLRLVNRINEPFGAKNSA